MKREHIVIVDWSWVGHHPIYVKAILKILLEAGYQVSVLCPDPEEITSWVNQNKLPEAGRFKAHYFADPELIWLWNILPAKLGYVLSPLMRWFHVSMSMRKINASSNKPNLVFFAWLDSYLTGYLPGRLIDWLFPYVWTGLYFHPKHLRVSRGDKKFRKGRFAPPENFMAKSRWVSSIAVLDAGIASALRSGMQGKRVVVFPDFTDELPPANDFHLTEEILAKAKGRKIIGLLGSLELRKGLMTLLRMAQQPAARDWYFIFAGELAEQTFSGHELKEIKSFFDVPRDNCLAFFQRIPEDSQFNALVNVCDVIFAAYQRFYHSSNIVTKAAAFGKPIIVSAGGYMEEVVKQYDLGEVIPAEDVGAALAALSKLTTRNVSHERLAGMRAYSTEQSQDKLRQSLLELVEDCMARSAHSRTSHVLRSDN